MLEDNNQIRNELFETIKELTDEQLNTHTEEDRWSILQILDHLYLMESGIVDGMQQALMAEDHPASTKPIHLTTNRSQKVEAPPYFVPSKNEYTLSTVKKKLEQSHASLIDFVATTDPDLLNRKSFIHPMFGLMNLSQWIPFIGLHEKRHIEQIEEIKQSLGFI